MTVYRIKLTDFEMRVLISILNERRLKLKQEGEPIDKIDDLLLKTLDVYEKGNNIRHSRRSGMVLSELP